MISFGPANTNDGLSVFVRQRSCNHIVYKSTSNNRTDDDETMEDTGSIPSADKIRKKIRARLRKDQEVRGAFEYMPYDTDQLRALRDAQGRNVTLDESVGSDISNLIRYDILATSSEPFLFLPCKPGHFYVRNKYKELYQSISDKWTSEFFRVVLLGNAGTGKSWFQVYALKCLLDCKERAYDIVIRQVGSSLSVIDLEEAVVYDWEVEGRKVVQMSRILKKTLYFFDPGDEPTKSPLFLFLPSLSTLSPFIDRIKEYRKNYCSELYFWPWSFGEMWCVVRDAAIPIEFDDFWDRYYKFGGILRHVLGEVRSADQQLTECLQQISIEILSSVALNVDRQLGGHNVSSFLVCYDSRWVTGHDRFSVKYLEYTSTRVEEEVEARLRCRSVTEKMDGVLKRIEGEMIDISGKKLEAVAMELLSLGTELSWSICEVGTRNASWKEFAMTKRKITRTYSVRENFHQPNMIIAPSNKRFPVVDFVFSWPHAGQPQRGQPQKGPPIVSFQCTWQTSHPFTVRALYDLRENHLAAADDQIVEIYIVSPMESAINANLSRQISDFLEGSLNMNLEYSRGTTVLASRLQTMWSNTLIFVIRPASSWQEHIRNYLSNH